MTGWLEAPWPLDQGPQCALPKAPDSRGALRESGTGFVVAAGSPA
jgi:hypothetical protein